MCLAQGHSIMTVVPRLGKSPTLTTRPQRIPEEESRYLRSVYEPNLEMLVEIFLKSPVTHSDQIQITLRRCVEWTGSTLVTNALRLIFKTVKACLTSLSAYVHVKKALVTTLNVGVLFRCLSREFESRLNRWFVPLINECKYGLYHLGSC